MIVILLWWGVEADESSCSIRICIEDLSKGVREEGGGNLPACGPGCRLAVVL